MDALVSLRRFGIVVHCIHELVGRVRRQRCWCSQELWVERLVLQWRGRIGARWSHDVPRGSNGGEMLQGYTWTGGIDATARLVGVGLSIHIQIDVHHGGTLRIGRRLKLCHSSRAAATTS